MDLKGKVVLITGGNGGIGEAMALRCAEEGASVAIAGRSEEKNARVLARIRDKGLEAMAIRADVTDEAEVKAMMDAVVGKYGRIDALVNNAGLFGNTGAVPEFIKPFDEITIEEWNTVMDINVLGVFLCCKHVSPIMKAQKSGSIVNVSSTTAWTGASRFLHYGASKGALLTMTMGMATALAPYNVRVNTLCPGKVMTDASLTMHDRETVEEGILAMQPLKIVTQPEDMAGIIVYLASDDSRIVTGQSFGVNGGTYMH